MIGVLFGANIILGLIIGLTTAMVQHHFKKIERSLQIYADPKAYKPRSNILFIESVMENIKKLRLEETKLEDIEKIIYKRFYQQKIGYFPYGTVQNIAIRGKFVMWCVLAGQIGIEILGKAPGASMSHFVFIVGSTLVCMFFTLVGIVKNVGEYRIKLFNHIKEYIVDTYPTEIQKRTKSKDIQDLLDKIDRLDVGTFVRETNEKVKEEKEMNLKEEDIRILLEKLDKEA